MFNCDNLRFLTKFACDDVTLPLYSFTRLDIIASSSADLLNTRIVLSRFSGDNINSLPDSISYRADFSTSSLKNHPRLYASLKSIHDLRICLGLNSFVRKSLSTTTMFVVVNPTLNPGIRLNSVSSTL